MKNWLQIGYNKIFLCVLLILIAFNVIATLSENEALLQLSKPLFIPVFVMYYYVKNKYISAVFILCLVFSFLGDFSSVFFSDEQLLQISSLFYCISYLCLVYAALSNIKSLNFDAIVGGYLIVVFAINTYLMYELFAVLKLQIPNGMEVALFGVKSMALIVLCFVAFIGYLNSDTKPSILFLAMALCFAFSDVLYYISNYYIYNWSFVMLDRILHIFGLFFLFNYIIELNRKRKKSLVELRVSSSDNALA
ncbi:hypothetical protein [Hanstruepera marina]|uniref:hypothetical protein n=1 Tax=Hanstruepera marina TaxID=2873265 RepID=UPI001CA623CE|nr:hypothetical protein [Hanstruepera marina]